MDYNEMMNPPKKKIFRFNQTEVWFMTHWIVHNMLDRTDHPPVPSYIKRQVGAIRNLAKKGIVRITDVDSEGNVFYVINKDALLEANNDRSSSARD